MRAAAADHDHALPQRYLYSSGAAESDSEAHTNVFDGRRLNCKLNYRLVDRDPDRYYYCKSARTRVKYIPYRRKIDVQLRARRI